MLLIGTCHAMCGEWELNGNPHTESYGRANIAGTMKFERVPFGRCAPPPPCFSPFCINFFLFQKLSVSTLCCLP